MKPFDWEKVESVFHGALELSAADRRNYLARECAGDERLAREVETLIKSFEKDACFLDEPALEFGFAAIHETAQKKLENRTLGTYRIEKKIGAGGMGDVYRAFDTKLNRRVALKFLSAALENDHSAKRLLSREAQAAAALDHPNICAVYGIEQIGADNFIVMQFVEGETLDTALANKTLSFEEFRAVAKQIVAAISFAHAHGVIHRDLKPGNIMLTNDGNIKILDFGLAKIQNKNSIIKQENQAHSRFSQNGLVIGTVAYMSPEQLRGERLDYRSDIFSLGVLFYELLLKENPFKRTSQAETIAALLGEESGELKRNLSKLPAKIGAFIEKCLRKEQDARFQSAAEMLLEIDQFETQSSSSKRRERLKFYAKSALAVLLLACVCAALFFYTGSRPQRTLAVLPFSLDGAETEKEYLTDGLTQSVIDKLANLSDLKVISKFAVAAYKNKKIEPQQAAQELRADAVFTGSIVRRDNNLYLLTKLIRASDNFVIDTQDLKIDESNLIELQEAIAARILAKAKSNLTDADKNRLAKRDTTSNEAKLLYLRGRFVLNRRSDSSDIRSAINLFTEAKELDPAFAKAWTGLADAYLNASLPGVEKAISPEEAVAKSKAAVKQALEIDENLCEAYHSRGMINLKYDWNWQEAKNNFRIAINCDAEFYPAQLGLVNVLRIEGRFQEALEETEKAKKEAPLAASPDLSRAAIYYNLRDYQKMQQILDGLTTFAPPSNRIAYTQAYQFLMTGKLKEAIQLLEKIYKSDKITDKVSVAAPLGFAYAKTGRRAEALKVIENLNSFAEKNYVPSQEKAIVYVGLGDYDRAFEFLSKSCSERFSALPALVYDPIIEEIKTDARFEKIVKCVNLER